jgi:putative phosphoribosyl transferase
MTTATSVSIPIGTDQAILGELVVPDNSPGLVVFAHGSGSSRHSPRNRAVAEWLQRSGLATLLIDLLTADEDLVDQRTAQHRFDIELLAERLERAERWAEERPDTARLRVGYFGASTGAGAALVAAARRPERVAAVVSRGGRPDLAGDSLRRVTAPTLLIVGSRDRQVIALNHAAARLIRGEVRLEVVEGATHLFEEPGTLRRVAELAEQWFQRHFTQSPLRAGSREN